jgi:hypothetical protein
MSEITVEKTKKVYAKPVLKVYGDVVSLTKGQGHGAGKDLFVGFPINPGNPGYKGPGGLSGVG